MNFTAVACALAAAALFGLSTPAAKILIGVIDPWLLAGLFYLGSGIGLAILQSVLWRHRPKAESPLTVRDLPWLAGAILFGGVIGPVLLLVGLARTDGATASLLLTLEGVATALIAWFAFRENFDRRIAAGMGLIAAGAMVLAWQDDVALRDIPGPLAIVGACIAWGLDNNLTRKVSLADPIQIAMVKGLVAGPVSLSLSLALGSGAMLPAFQVAFVAGLVGFLGYGVSLALFVVALRHLGTARTGAYFSTAPFIGAVAALPMLDESLSMQLAIAGLLMAAGVWLHLTERHEHEHEHDPIEHAHRHVHDAHHRHAHGADDPPGEPHSHRHAHVRLRHTHPHTPDAHHRHGH